MDSIWSWKSRKRFLFFVKIGAWILYLVGAWIWLELAVPDIVATTFTDPTLALGVYGTVVGIPGLYQLRATYLPGTFLQNTTRIRVRYYPNMQNQLSRRSSLNAPAGSSRYAADGFSDVTNLSNLAPRAGNGQSSRDDVASVWTAWDDWVFNASRLVDPSSPAPRLSGPARIYITSQGFGLAVGLWRPGRLFEVPLSRITGIWRGSEISKTIEGDGNVLVFSVRTDDDEMLFPFQVHRWIAGNNKSKNIQDLIHQIEATWGRQVVAPVGDI